MNNFIYWISWSITLALELSLIYNMLKYWQWSWIDNIGETWMIFIIWSILTICNLFPVNNYGNIEFIITIFKIFS